MQRMYRQHKWLTCLFLAASLLCTVDVAAVNAMRIIDVPDPAGNAFFRFEAYDKGETIKDEDGDDATSEFTLNDAEIKGIIEGSRYWSTMLAPGARLTEPLLLSLLTVDAYDDNASAQSESYGDSGYTKLAAGMYGLPSSGFLAEVHVDHAQYFDGQWYTKPMSSLPSNGEASDLPSTMTHELTHALGLCVVRSVNDTKDGFIFANTGLNLWTLGLHDINGNAAKPGQDITLAEEATEGAFVTRDKSQWPGVYFTGTHVQDVLKGALLASPDDTNAPRVPGLPVNGWEDTTDEETGQTFSMPEFSHIELQNSLMSHQNYRNWNILMEAELAAMQDVGLVLDRRNYYGSSLYNDGLTYNNTNPYYARNNDGWIVGASNPTAYGIGFHVYGSDNTINQSADLLSSGDWGMGIRMDGTGNSLTINPGVRVHANGNGGNALLVAYGNGHNVIHRGDLQALGAGGTAARFDFGSNEMGDRTEYRGSYIRSAWGKDENRWGYADMLSALQGPLVESFDVTGRLAGTDAAIFISPNAFVKKINIMNGASLSGAVVSEWDPYNPLVQYEGNREDLFTSLTFGLQADAAGQATTQADAHFRLRYAGDIRGAAGLRLHLAGGLLAYDGTAAVRDVTVAAGAILGGNGTYTAETFLNQGTVMPGNSIGTLTVNGNYAQADSGTLVTEFDSSGQDTLRVNGNAALAGTLTLAPLPDGYAGTLPLSLLQVTGTTSGAFATTNTSLHSPTLRLTATQRGNDTLATFSRSANAYSQYAADGNAARVGRALADVKAMPGDMRNLFTALDFSAMNGSSVREGLSQLAPDAYGNAALATLDTHRMLSDLILPGTLSRSRSNTAADSAWRVSVQPYAGNVAQSNGNAMSGYEATNVGLITVAERSTQDGLTIGGHVVFNHQSMNGDTNGKLHGEGLYLGAQSSYAPASWDGWNLFGIGRIGMENWRMQREVAFTGYERENTKDWTGFSGTLSAGGGYEWIFDSFRAGPFVALDYAFASRPSLTEDDGLSSRLHLASDVFHSLRSSLGARLTTDEQALGDRASWQSHASVAWNHELLDKAGTLHASFAQASDLAFANTLKAPGRDTLGLGVGLTVTTNTDLSFSLNAGSELFRHEGTSVYGNLSLGWKF
ncbi:MAG: autotransporter domain-containing protein [Bilophila sp.]